MSAVTLNTGRAVQEQPCGSCEATPCCWYVTLDRIRPHHYDQLDRLVYASGFERIEIGAHHDGTFGIYYRAPCRHLRPEAPPGKRCAVYATPWMPTRCRKVESHGCWFRQHVPVASTGFLRLDEGGVRAVAELYTLDLQRNVSDSPSWPEIQRAVRALEPQDPARLTSQSDPPPYEVAFPWEAAVENPGHTLPPAEELGWGDVLASPCADCSAFCCTHMVLPLGRPKRHEDIDRILYFLQFPGVELGISDDAWSVAVRSPCRHLDANAKCSLFGDPRRPRRCVDYNEWRCTYRPRFSPKGKSDVFRVGYSDFLAIAERVAFRPSGMIRHLPNIEEAIRSVVSHRESAEADAPQ